PFPIAHSTPIDREYGVAQRNSEAQDFCEGYLHRSTPTHAFTFHASRNSQNPSISQPASVFFRVASRSCFVPGSTFSPSISNPLPNVTCQTTSSPPSVSFLLFTVMGRLVSTASIITRPLYLGVPGFALRVSRTSW